MNKRYANLKRNRQKKLDCQGRLVLTVFIMKRNKEKIITRARRENNEMKRRISKNAAVFVAIAFHCYANIKKRI